MRRLVLLALVALVAVPLSAHDHWRGPRRVVEDSYSPHYRGEGRRWDDGRWERRAYERRYDRRYERRYDCDDERMVLRPLPHPLALPFPGRVELWIR